MKTGWMSDLEMDTAIRKGDREGDIYRLLKHLRDHYAGLIKDKYPPIPRRVSGYNLDQLIPNEEGRFNVARALVGSESTLVTVLEAKVTLVDARAQRVILMLGYPDIYEAADHVMEIVAARPTALEGIDERLMENVQKKGGPHRRYLNLLPEGKGWLMVELGGDHKDEALEAAHRLMEELQRQPNAPSMKLYTDHKDMDHIWEVRESGLGATAFVPGERDAWPGWEDSAVAPQKLGGYLRELRTLYNKYDYSPALYGHFGQGCVHCRVQFDVASETGIRHMGAFLEEATDLVVKYDGSLSGEHGDGQARAQYLHKMFGDELMGAFREFKSIWDPDWKMNPGKLVEPYRYDQNLRLGADYKPWDPQTHFKFPEDNGSFASTTSSATTSGMTVIFSAFSHSVPMNPAVPMRLAWTGPESADEKEPAVSPNTSAPSVQ
jgi:FAD/FMN-containing dehydrogenase